MKLMCFAELFASRVPQVSDVFSREQSYKLGVLCNRCAIAAYISFEVTMAMKSLSRFNTTFQLVVVPSFAPVGKKLGNLDFTFLATLLT